MTITYGSVRATIHDTRSETGAPPVQLRLSPRTVMSLAGRRRGLTFRCHAGNLWLTRTGDPADHLLAPGDTRQVKGLGRIVLQSLTESVVSISPTE
jgi:hypothetical protein